MFEHLDIDRHTETRQQWEALLASAGLRVDPPYSAVYGIFEDSRLVATGARDENRLKCIAVDQDCRGGPLFNRLLTGIIAHAFDLGINKLYLYTKPTALSSFSRVGFHALASTPQGITFMERGRPSLDEYIEACRLTTEAADKRLGRPTGAVESLVIRGDPFSDPGIALAAEVASRADRVHLFVMGEKSSMNEVREKTKDLACICHPAQGYFIPPEVFPSYYLADKNQGVKVQAALDALLLRDRIAPALGITGRTVLEDPADPLRLLYNESLASLLPPGLNLTRISPASLN